MFTSSSLASSGFELDISSASFGSLRNSARLLGDEAALRHNLKEDGYLYVPDFFPRDEVLAVRDEFLRRLRQNDCLDLDHAETEMVASPDSVNPNRKELLESNNLLTDLVFSSRLKNFYAGILGGPVRAYDHIWIRLVRPGKGTQPHCDLPYMGRGTRNVMTAWIPYRDTSRELGGLMILEKSHQQSDRIRQYLDSDVDTFCANRGPYKHKAGWLSNNPVTLREKFGGRWLTAEFRPGDLLTFGMSMIHASLDNQTSSFRLSTDTRYQLASEPVDPRWIGSDTEEYAEKNRIGKIC